MIAPQINAGSTSQLFPTAGLNDVAHDPPFIQLLLITLGDFLVVFTNLGDPVVVSILHGVVGATFTEAYDLNETNSDVFPRVYVVVVYPKDVIPVEVRFVICGGASSSFEGCGCRGG